MNFQSDMYSLFSFHGFASLIALALLELVLGIDNIIFIALVISKLPEEKKLAARAIGLSLALVMRILMLFGLVLLSRITTNLFSIYSFNVSVRDFLFFAGGAYLAWNTFFELREHISRTRKQQAHSVQKQVIYKTAILQIVMVDMLFSFDSIFTAIGLIQNFVIMALAVVCGMSCMLWLSGKTADFINRHPTVKTLALSFIMGVALLLISSSFHLDVPKTYFYSAFAFALVVELLNICMQRKKE